MIQLILAFFLKILLLISKIQQFIRRRGSLHGTYFQKTQDFHLCFRLAFLRLVYYFVFLICSLSLSFWTVSDAVLNHVLMYLSMENLKPIQRDQLTYYTGTNRSCELYYNFTILNGHIEMNDCPIRVPDCDFHGLALLDLFIHHNIFLFSTHMYIFMYV